ncbi:hypothetical protein VTN00DRAFT_429 [Thermoascus crustaceus]|uniref:uncharacterized protein n=1 Tax=Thermoascus crustaceus TaxID=5088 RepID=UPI0037421178
MPPPPTKRQKREQYRQAQAQAQQNEGAAAAAPIKLPKKKFYRQRAHANPFSDHQLDYPISPAHMNWATHFPAFVDPDPNSTNLSGARNLIKDVEVVDIGCGYGGLLVGLAPLLPDTLMVGMEIRTQVLEYLTTRINVLRQQQLQLLQQKATSSTSASPSATSPPPPQPTTPSETLPQPTETTAPSPSPSTSSTSAPTTLIPGGYQNISALRTNTMKFLPNFFARGQLSKIFICFPDPHFKARKHKARIVSPALNAEYAFVLRPGGLLYTITDVEEYHRWILRHFVKRNKGSKPEGDGREEAASEDEEEAEDEREGNGDTGIKELWERVSDEELEKDPCVAVMREETEEGKKVTRNKGNKYVAVFRRLPDPEWPAAASS